MRRNPVMAGFGVESWIDRTSGLSWPGGTTASPTEFTGMLASAT